jgi:diguanylate cyclase (GGDEF)-like protein
LAGVIALCAALFAVTASAQPIPGTVCHAYSDKDITLEQAAGALDWQCDREGWIDGQQVTWLLFSGWEEGAPPLQFSSRATVFDRVEIAAIGGGMMGDRRSYTIEDAKPQIAGPVFSLDLPKADPSTDAYIVRILRPHALTIASEANVTRDPQGEGVSPLALILLAMVAGMLIMPILFDAIFYMVLRERFVLLHAGMTLSALTYVMAAGGVVHGFADVPVRILASLGPLSWAIYAGLGGLFLTSFLEEGALSGWMRKLLCAVAIWTMLVPGFFALQLDLTQTFDNRAYFLTITPTIPVYVLAIVSAILSGSRSARFLFAAWLPVIAAGIDRMLRGLGLYSASSSIDQALFLAMAIEVMIIALAVADRILAVRRERDRALTQAQALAELSERDPMTGLYNRRAIEAQFDLLRARGFTTFALLDLDRFKEVNDTFGHGVGDDVLRAVAKALQPNEDVIAMRMGGEEFALLLRGPRPAERAENRRQAIVRQVAEATNIDRPVTASMGLVDAPRDSLAKADFDQIYRRADRLLYEAKAAGRNRTMREKLKVFRPRSGKSRRSEAA